MTRNAWASPGRSNYHALMPPVAFAIQLLIFEPDDLAERVHILQTLERFGRNHSGAPEALGIHGIDG